jgi:hypothetical protein
VADSSVGALALLDHRRMVFQDQEKRRLAEYASGRWGVGSHVIPCEFAAETLQDDIRQSALEYFRRHGIQWWTSRWDRRTAGMDPRPTGHLNSSQVACVNHLEPARVDRAAAEVLFGALGSIWKPRSWMTASSSTSGSVDGATLARPVRELVEQTSRQSTH